MNETMLTIEKIQQEGMNNPIDLTVADSLNALIPHIDLDTNSDEYAEIEELDRALEDIPGMEALPEETFNQVLESCFKQGSYAGFRNALYFTVQANWGIRVSDARMIKYIDFINVNGKFREYCLLSELKTDKSRQMFINEAVMKCVLMVIWNGDFEPLDYLIRASGNLKNYRKAIDPCTKKVIRKNGKYVYELDKNGDKIPEPLTTKSIREIMTEKLVDDLGIQLKRHKRCTGGKFKYATHSLRKLYSEKVEAAFYEKGRTHTEAMKFLQWDLRHDSPLTTTRYCRANAKIKKEIVMEMNLGLDVINKYFELEKAKYLAKIK